MAQASGASLRDVGRVSQAGWSLPAHRHERWHELILVLAGRIETAIAGQTLLGAPGDMLFYPLGQAHAERALGDEPLETLFIAWHEGDPPGDWPLLSHDRDGRVQYLLRWLAERQGAPRPDRAMLNSLLDALLHEWARLLRDEEDPWVRQVTRHMQARLAEPLRLDDLAEQAGLSRFHFARRFAAATGQPPMRYLRALRVQAARTLLLNTPLPLKAIAPMVGFADEYHLSKVFRRHTGTPPGAARGPAPPAP